MAKGSKGIQKKKREHAVRNGAKESKSSDVSFPQSPPAWPLQRPPWFRGQVTKDAALDHTSDQTSFKEQRKGRNTAVHGCIHIIALVEKTIMLPVVRIVT